MFKKRVQPAQTTPHDLIRARAGADGGVNGVSLASMFKARGRYELARVFQQAGTAWYADNVVGKPNPSDSPEQRQKFADVLIGYHQEVDALYRATQDRAELLKLIQAAPDGLTQDELASLYTLTGTIKMGVMLNQLERGEWIVRQGDGKKAKVLLSVAPLPSDVEFMAAELDGRKQS